jgi:hypothetical protein
VLRVLPFYHVTLQTGFWSWIWPRSL